jgi:hypothetical protein
MKIPYEQAINHFLKSKLNMISTFAERLEYIIPRRARYYTHKGKGVYPAVNSDIWNQLTCLEGWLPAGGLVSTVPDLLKFGNIMLKSYLGNDGKIRQIECDCVHDALNINQNSFTSSFIYFQEFLSNQRSKSCGHQINRLDSVGLIFIMVRKYRFSKV